MKFCKDCKHYRSSPLGFDNAICTNPARLGTKQEYYNRVAGYVTVKVHSQYCSTARSKQNDPCSLEGKQWEPKPTPITFFNKLKGLFTK